MVVTYNMGLINKGILKGWQEQQTCFRVQLPKSLRKFFHLKMFLNDLNIYNINSITSKNSKLNPIQSPVHRLTAIMFKFTTPSWILVTARPTRQSIKINSQYFTEMKQFTRKRNKYQQTRIKILCENIVSKLRYSFI